MYVGSSGHSRGSCVHSYTSRGGSSHGFSSTPASIERPHKFSSVEYGDCDVAGTSMPCFCAYSISSSRFMPHSLTGATTSRSGASAAVATSNRTWSLPLPVQPCAMAVAPSRRATCTSIAAMRGRPSAVASGYSFSYTAPACSEGQTNSSRNGCLPSATYAADAPVFSALACTASRSFFSPRSTVKAITSQPRSFSQRMATEVSSPPE